MKNLFKSTMTLVLVASQLGLSATAWSAPSNSPSPETILLQNAMALQGSALSSKTVQSQLDSAIEAYANTAPEEGRSERLQSALVDMGILNADQAEEFTQSSQASATRLVKDDASIQQEKLTSEMNKVLEMKPKGAQFSGCDFAQIVGGAGVVGGVAMVAGGFVTLLVGHHIRGETESCVEENITTTQGGVTASPGTIAGSGVVTTSRQNVCTRASNANANIHSGDVDMQHGRFVIDLGAYILAAGIISFIVYESSSCDN